MSVDMASAIFPLHEHDVHCLHLSFPADIQEPDEAKSVTEEPKEAGKKTLQQQNKTKHDARDSSRGIKTGGFQRCCVFLESGV
jgi:hypothetical protein